MNVSDYVAQDGVGLARLIERKEVSRREVIEAAISVIESRDAALNAVVMRNFDPSCSRSDTGAASALRGVPLLLKDVNLYSSDMPTTFGSAFFKGAPAKPDSIMVDRWRRAGLAILGKTNTPEFAAEFVTEPRAYGTTRNPRDLNLTVGGSSGGAAAAVAAGMVPIAHATDLGGSIRIPAACCGVFGFKPTGGFNPTGPYFDEIAGGLNSDHVITRTVRDSAASLDITADFSPQRHSYLEGLDRPVRQITVGVCCTDPAGRPCGPDQQEAVNRAAQVLESFGHRIVEYRYPEGLDASNWFDHLWIFDLVRLVEERSRELGRAPAAEELEPLTWHLLEKAKAGGNGAHERARSAREIYTSRYLGSMESIHVCLTPTLATDPPNVGSLSFRAFGDVEAWNAAGYRFAPYSIPSNISGQPSASCPYFKNSSGLSVGVQISGKPGDDLLVLQLCAQLELCHAA
ncbi:amidase [Mesorhizobium sp. B2-4-17]|uniref:amidase n=1 Tax=Mesorhizobium sp. B2-4-17 TaxID=2589932 RepID=UPI0011263326|nr:amidase [Mesorhizobium sp. B2-4-17]TPK90229.1 amidase [Mesorhizobium sp. B2-4-17]